MAKDKDVDKKNEQIRKYLDKANKKLKSYYFPTFLPVMQVIIIYLVLLALFIAGLLNGELFDRHLGVISNRTIFWSIVVPMIGLFFAFSAQAVIFSSDYKRLIKILQNKYEDEIVLYKNSTELFKAIGSIQRDDLYTSIVFNFLMNKLRYDLVLINEKSFFASGMYWDASNEFIFSQRDLFCTCTLKPKQLTENDITRYFDQQANKIREGALRVTRVMLWDDSKYINNYADFIYRQMDQDVNIEVVAKDDSAHNGEIPDEEWSSIKKDFALAGNKYLMLATIENNDLKGYTITEIQENEALPLYIDKIMKYKQPLVQYRKYIDTEHEYLKQLLNIS